MTRRPDPCPRRPLRRRGQSGLVLAEALATIVFAGVAVLAVLTAMLAIFTSSDIHRKSVRSGLEATGVVERLQRATYVPCAQASDYAAAVGSVSGLNLSITQVGYLVSRNATSASFQTNRSTCTSTGDQGVQRLRVRAAPSDGTAGDEEILIDKRDDRCPTTTPTIAGQTC